MSNIIHAINTEDCCLALRKATRALTRIYDKSLSKIGIRSTQLTLLIAIVSNKEASITDLAKDLIMDRTTLTRNLKPLINKGLIKLIDNEGQRYKGYELTEEGNKLVQKASPLWQIAQNQFLGKIGSKRHIDLLKELKFLRDLDNRFEECRLARNERYREKHGG